MTAAPAALGTIAKYVSPSSEVLVAGLAAMQAADAGARRFMRQAAARDILRHRTKLVVLADGSTITVPLDRVCVCLRSLRPDAAGVELWRSLRFAAAHYKQLVVCGSVWMCGVCAARITEERRVELSDAVRAHTGAVAFVTLTLQHTAADAVQVVVDGVTEAARLMRGGKRWVNFSRQYGFEFASRGKVEHRIGSVRSLENTVGDNGHHPHLHYLFFLAPGIDFAAFEVELRQLWLAAVARVGRFASPKWGITVEHADADIADYVAKFGKEPKWTAPHELAKSWSKAGGAGHFSMATLLDVYLVGGDPQARQWWLDYAVAFKGKRQLVWSDGLRAHLLPGSVELTDEQLVEVSVEDASYLATLDLDAWRVVLAQDARYELLQAAAAGDAGEIRRFLLSIGVSEGVDYVEGA